MTFDPSISIGGIANIVVIVIGGLAFLFSMRSTMTILTTSVSDLSQRIDGVERDIKELNRVVITNAVNEEKISSLRGDLQSFMQNYITNHQQIRRDFETRMDKIEALLRT